MVSSGRFFFIDLDKFKPINDALGHEIGDWLLRSVAQRMTECVRESDTVARIGGDEFAVLLPSITGPQDARMVAEKIRVAIERPFITPAGTTLAVSCCIGVALYPEHGFTQRDLLRAADESIYRAKKGGGNAIELCGLLQAEPVAPTGQAIIRLVWKTDYLSGDPNIDREHQALFQLANQLLEQTTEPHGDPELFNAALDSLQQHIATHFANEEQLLLRIGFPDAGEHAAQHAQLLEQVMALRGTAAKRRITTGELVDFLANNVIHDHLLDMDRNYFSHLAARSAEAS